MAKRRVQGRDGCQAQAAGCDVAVTRDFMTGWGVVAAYVALPACTKTKTERFVAKESRALAGFGADQAEYLRGMYAALSAAVAR